MTNALRLGMLLSVLASACGPSTNDAVSTVPTDAGPADETPDALPIASDVASPELDDAAHDAADAPDAASADSAPTDARDAAPPPPAWDACDVVPAGAPAPIKLATPVFPRHAAGSLTVTGDRLLFISSSSSSSSEISVAKTTPGFDAMTLWMEPDLTMLVTNGKDVVFASASTDLGSTDLVGSWPSHFGGWARGLAVDDLYAYYTRRGIAKDGSDGSLFRVPIGGSGPGTEIGHGPVGSGLAIDSSGLYVGGPWTPPLETPVLYVVAFSLDATSAETIATRPGYFDSYLALTSSHVVVLAEGSKASEIFAVRKADKISKTLTTVSHPFEREIHADATHAFWIEGHEIRRVALDGTKPVETVFRGACSPTSMTVDGENVYFLTSPLIAGKGTTTVWKLKKA